MIIQTQEVFKIGRIFNRLLTTKKGHMILYVLFGIVAVIVLTLYLVLGTSLILDFSGDAPERDMSKYDSSSVRQRVMKTEEGVFANNEIGDESTESETEAVTYDPNSVNNNTDMSATVSYANVVTEGGGKGLSNLWDGWLQLYDGPTVKGEAYEVSIPSSYTARKWSMGEGGSYSGNSNCINYYQDKVVQKGPSGIGLINSSGRYWVAVGPKVTNPQFKCDNSKAGHMASECALPKLYDIVLSDGDNTYYLPCVTGDSKAHTYPTGIVQTGIHVHYAEDLSHKHNDSSIVEFVGVDASRATDLNKSLEIVKIIVYK